MNYFHGPVLYDEAEVEGLGGGGAPHPLPPRHFC